MKRRMKRTEGRRGSMMTQAVLFSSTVGVGVMALAIDTGLMFNAKQELQNAADAAALAGASQLGAMSDGVTLAETESSLFSSLNKVAGNGADIDVDTDLVFGHAVLNGEKYNFLPNQEPYDAVQVNVHRDVSAADGPVSLLFAKALGVGNADISASATAMLLPRDVAVVIDLSGSMNDDSELRHYDQFTSESGGTRPGVQINLEDVWLALPCEKGNNGVGNGIDPPPPGNPTNLNDQPGTGPGAPNSQGGNPSPGANPSQGGACGGPRWGWMTGFGNEIVLGSYTPVGDPGLYYIPKGATCSDAEVVSNLTEAGYSSTERTALLNGSYDGVSEGESTLYKNRVLVCLGLAGWKSQKPVHKFSGDTGDGDDQVEFVDSKELAHKVSWPFADGSWDEYIDYVRSNSSQMFATDPNFRYRYGIKTIMNYLLEKQANHADCPELASAAEEPLNSVKGAVQALVDEMVSLETQDHVSLEAFAQYGYHLHDLVVPTDPSELATLLQEIPTTLSDYQAGHYTSTTNIGAGMAKAIAELQSTRARNGVAKVIIMLTDGKPNVNENDAHVGNDDPAAVSWAMEQADAAKAMGATVYTIGVGADLNDELLTDMASQPEYYFFADNSPDPENGGVPMYVSQLQSIFQTLGGRRPVRLIQ